MTTDAEVRATSVVRFPVEIDFPKTDEGDLVNASEAVKREFRNSVRWKRLRCRNVTSVVERKDEAIYVLEIGQSVEFDWTWEGAIAFRPTDLDGFDGNTDATGDFATHLENEPAGVGWSGEIVEVDEANGRIFIWMSGPLMVPTTGSFYVRPFEFLAFLHTIYCEPALAALRKLLPQRLNATRGDVHPVVARNQVSGQPELQKFWSHAWGVLWGPPGTGKTYSVGQQVAACLSGSKERILIVSTTNKATDEVAHSIGKAVRTWNVDLVEGGRILRIGKSANYEMYETHGLLGLLKGTETEFLHEIARLTKELHRAATHEERAVIRKNIQAIRRMMKDASFNIFVSEDVQVVVATSFKAMTLLNDQEIRAAITEGDAPFTTIVIDEAGLISRAAVAALSLLASRRIVLVGDSKQLAPISRISRILPTTQATWLAASGLSHLRLLDQANDAIHLLRHQYRMHPHISAVVSAYQYENKLLDHPSVTGRPFVLPAILEQQARSIWYVLDDDSDDLPSIRAERGPGNKSWVRPKTRAILTKLFTDELLRRARGLFISPFAAQARDIKAYLAAEGLDSWSAATVHSQQGTEADFVIFDTVNAGSCGWSYDEWKRLVNVGLSRARECVIVLASRAEMREPYLKSLTADLSPRILKWSGRSHKWQNVPAEIEFEVPENIAANPHLLGSQIIKRKELRPVLGFEQQRLCGLNMDGKPRLVRGVAGSGKTVVLAHWVLQTMQRLRNRPETKIWAVVANRSLTRLITDTIEEAWKSEGEKNPFPWHRVELWHILDVLQPLLQEAQLRASAFEFNYDAAAAAYLGCRDVDEIQARCHAMFIDEAQDMGPNTLKLLSALVAKSDENDPKSRSVNIFYDNAQNLYGRSTPRWAELGLDMRGRSTIMKESFRSTRPITEYAINVLYRLQPAELDADHKELVKLGLIERISRNRKDWWSVRFNQVDGPLPFLKRFDDIEAEFDSLGDQIVKWIKDEGVRPSDICIIYNGQSIPSRIESQVTPKLEAIGAKLLIQTGQAFNSDALTVIATTAHSFKGYDAEVIVIAGADHFVAREKGVLANNLYVAMTRARSILAIYGQQVQKPRQEQIMSVLEECLDDLVDHPQVQRHISNIDEFEELVQHVGAEHREWLESLSKRHCIEQEPILGADGEIVAEPLFWFKSDERVCVCFGKRQPGRIVLDRIEDAGIQNLVPGAEFASNA